MATIETICPVLMRMGDFDAMTEHLAEQPVGHAALLALARRSQSMVSLQRRFVVAYGAGGRVLGIMFAHPQTMISQCHPNAVAAFARMTLKPRAMRALIGPDQTVAQFVDEKQRAGAHPPRFDTLQYLYAVSSLALEPAFFSPYVAEATMNDLDTVVSGAAAMIVDELGYDPRRRSTFRREICNQILARRWWIAQNEGLHLLCRIGPTTLDTMQLECVWSPPTSRGVGRATRSLATICAQLLKRRATLSLAVDTTNERAIRLYERIGFRRERTQQRTMLW